MDDKALEEIRVVRRIVNVLRPFSQRQRARILQFLMDECRERLEEAAFQRVAEDFAKAKYGTAEKRPWPVK